MTSITRHHSAEQGREAPGNVRWRHSVSMSVRWCTVALPVTCCDVTVFIHNRFFDHVNFDWRVYYGITRFFFRIPNSIFEALIDIYVVEKPILDSEQTSKQTHKKVNGIDFSNARTEVALRAMICKILQYQLITMHRIPKDLKTRKVPILFVLEKCNFLLLSPKFWDT